MNERSHAAACNKEGGCADQQSDVHACAADAIHRAVQTCSRMESNCLAAVETARRQHSCMTS